MGQKINPIGLRTGINRTWDSKWFADKRKYAALLHSDVMIRRLIQKKLVDCGLSRIEIDRNANQVTITVHTSRPGIVIGGQGAGIDALRKMLESKLKDKFIINIKEIKKPYHEAAIVAELIGHQIEKRIPYRRACKMMIERAMESGVKGIKINCAGRLNGVEIARTEFFVAGKVPLATFRADIDFAVYHAITTYGAIGVKVWVYRGEVFNK